MLGLTEIHRRRVPFALITAIVALVSYLVVIVNALGDGLEFVSGSAILAMDADAFAYSDDSGLSVLFSEFDDETVGRIVDFEGVEQVGAISYVVANYERSDGQRKPAAFFGYDPYTIGEPELIAGRRLQYFDKDGALVDRRFLDATGLEIGDRFSATVRLTSRSFVIRGVVDEGYFFFQPVIYTLRQPVIELLHGAPYTPDTEVQGPILAEEIDPVADASSGRDTGVPPVRRPHSGDIDEMKEAEAVPPPRLPFRQTATIVLLKGEGLTGRAGDGFQIVSQETAFHHVEGVEIQQTTVSALSAFGYLIGAVVVGVFFYVLTMQKVQQIGMLKAVGATNTFIIRQMLSQVLVLGVLGILVSAGFAFLTEELLSRFPDSAPVILEVPTMVITGLLVLLTAAAGTLLSARQVMRIDPIIALGQQQ
jgi:putative ABC transport system permease protein